ncbi:MAG TPA: hypothetical protein VJI46_05760 [Candidatus Nanoarchaeia archaeon]|nr:hypothetical protein [Candidatus Nanoarchaeia archaeon]
MEYNPSLENSAVLYRLASRLQGAGIEDHLVVDALNEVRSLTKSRGPTKKRMAFGAPVDYEPPTGLSQEISDTFSEAQRLGKRYIDDFYDGLTVKEEKRIILLHRLLRLSKMAE